MNSSISILFAGDFAPCRRFESLVLGKGPEIFGNLQKDIAGADLSFLNLETPLCIKGKPVEKTGPNLKAHPDCIKAVKDAGFEVVGLANNHIMDFGNEGLEETIRSCKSVGLTNCGAGKNLTKAQQILIIERCGLKIAYIAVAEHEFSIAGADRAGAAPLDPVDITLQIESIRNQVDLVFVTIHGGNEYFPLPRPGLRKLCRYCITRGADAVICHHTHVPGAYEIYKNKPIVYSLGNLIFDHPSPPEGWNEGYVVKLDYNINDMKLSNFKVLPYTQSVDQGGLYRMSGTDETVFFKKMAAYNKILNDEDLYIKAWNDFCENEKNTLLMKHFSPVHFRGMRKFGKIINPELFFLPTKKNRLVKLNLIRCESHLELLQNVLSKGEIDIG
jgi:poly-gamma-glutamate capsule biosynthesis protein CapA/YwtB (metallophosphatase superfamily)